MKLKTAPDVRKFGRSWRGSVREVKGFDHTHAQPVPGGAWLEASHKAHCNEETTTTIRKEEDLEPVVAKHTSKLLKRPPDPPHWTARFLWNC